MSYYDEDNDLLYSTSPNEYDDALEHSNIEHEESTTKYLKKYANTPLNALSKSVDEDNEERILKKRQQYLNKKALQNDIIQKKSNAKQRTRNNSQRRKARSRTTYTRSSGRM